VSRIARRFRLLAEQGRRALVPYIVAGDPALEATVPMMHALVKNGADIIELGVPFSDPMSEGPVIQLAHERALANGTSLRDALRLVGEFRQRDHDTPVLLMGYANPVEHMGYGHFADAAAQVGLDALLTVDIPPEEVTALNDQLRRVGMDNIFLVAPTTPDDRLARIVAQASGFIYYVALKGVTGAGNLDPADVARQVARIRSVSDLPVAVGFGIKDADSAAAVSAVADGVVIGSALVSRLAEAGSAEDACAIAADFLAPVREGMDNSTP
jgi:tryptophan synthase alpha chain